MNFNDRVSSVALIIWKGDSMMNIKGCIEPGDLGPGFFSGNGGDENINESFMVMRMHT